MPDGSCGDRLKRKKSDGEQECPDDSAALFEQLLAEAEASIRLSPPAVRTHRRLQYLQVEATNFSSDSS